MLLEASSAGANTRSTPFQLTFRENIGYASYAQYCVLNTLGNNIFLCVNLGNFQEDCRTGVNIPFAGFENERFTLDTFLISAVNGGNLYELHLIPEKVLSVVIIAEFPVYGFASNEDAATE